MKSFVNNVVLGFNFIIFLCKEEKEALQRKKTHEEERKHLTREGNVYKIMVK